MLRRSMECKKCKSTHIVKAGYKKLSDGKVQRYKCQECKHYFTNQEKLSFGEKAAAIDAKTKQEIMDKFEEIVFPGIASENSNITWVQHSDKNGRLELNFVIPRVFMGKQKNYSFNPYLHKTDKHRITLFRDYVNVKYGFTNPLNPKNKQHFSIGEAVKYSNTEHLIKLGAYLEKLVAQKLIINRDGIIEELEALGYTIKRKGKNYLSVKSPSMKKALRLEGSFFEEDFNCKVPFDKMVHPTLGAIEKRLMQEVDKAALFWKRKFKQHVPYTAVAK